MTPANSMKDGRHLSIISPSSKNRQPTENVPVVDREGELIASVQERATLDERATQILDGNNEPWPLVEPVMAQQELWSTLSKYVDTDHLSDDAFRELSDAIARYGEIRAGAVEQRMRSEAAEYEIEIARLFCAIVEKLGDVVIERDSIERAEPWRLQRKDAVDGSIVFRLKGARS